ncbi:MAG: hypothetical protein WCC90_23185 [Methylocella sp.]
MRHLYKHFQYIGLEGHSRHNSWKKLARMIAEGPFYFLRSASFPSFSEISSKKNIGELLPKESKNYLVLSQYDCGPLLLASPRYSVVYDQGVAYFEAFPETHGPVNLALRHQVLAYILITIGIITIVNFIYYLTTKLIIAILTALRTTTSPAEAAGDKPSGTSEF